MHDGIEVALTLPLRWKGSTEAEGGTGNFRPDRTHQRLFHAGEGTPYRGGRSFGRPFFVPGPFSR